MNLPVPKSCISAKSEALQMSEDAGRRNRKARADSTRGKMRYLVGPNTRLLGEGNQYLKTEQILGRLGREDERSELNLDEECLDVLNRQTSSQSSQNNLSLSSRY